MPNLPNVKSQPVFFLISKNKRWSNLIIKCVISAPFQWIIEKGQDKSHCHAKWRISYHETYGDVRPMYVIWSVHKAANFLPYFVITTNYLNSTFYKWFSEWNTYFSVAGRSDICQTLPSNFVSHCSVGSRDNFERTQWLRKLPSLVSRRTTTGTHFFG